MNVRSILVAPALALVVLSQVACSSLSRPEEITIVAEPARPPSQPEPAAPHPAPHPAPGGAAPAQGG